MNCCPGLPGSNFLLHGGVTAETPGEKESCRTGVIFAELYEKSTKTGEIIAFFFSKIYIILF